MFTEANVYDKMVELLNKVSDAGQSPNYWGNKQANKNFFKTWCSNRKFLNIAGKYTKFIRNIYRNFSLIGSFRKTFELHLFKKIITLRV